MSHETDTRRPLLPWAGAHWLSSDDDQHSNAEQHEEDAKDNHELESARGTVTESIKTRDHSPGRHS